MESRLHHIFFAFVCGTMLAASAGATGYSRLKRSEDLPEQNREAFLGKPSRCERSCGRVFPDRGEEGKVWMCKEECEKGNWRWTKPSSNVRSCEMECEMKREDFSRLKPEAEDCNERERCRKRCYGECNDLFFKQSDAGKSLLLCKGLCRRRSRRRPSPSSEVAVVGGCSNYWKAGNHRYNNPKTCQRYIDEKWCTEEGALGPRWKDEWGSFTDYADANGNTALVCPQCGCGKGLIGGKGV